jgi:hypothetical protein
VEVVVERVGLLLFGRVVCVQQRYEHLGLRLLGDSLPLVGELVGQLVQVLVVGHGSDEVRMGVGEGPVSFDRWDQERELRGVVGVLCAKLADRGVLDELGPVLGVFLQPLVEQVGLRRLGHGVWSDERRLSSTEYGEGGVPWLVSSFCFGQGPRGFERDHDETLAWVVLLQALQVSVELGLLVPGVLGVAQGPGATGGLADERVDAGGG